MPKFRLEPHENQPLAGFSLANYKPGESGYIHTQGFVHSDEPLFYKYVTHLSRQYLNRFPISVNEISTLLVIIHHDLSADIYINDFVVTSKFRAKRDFTKGQIITLGDIIDIAELMFPEIVLDKRDSLVFCWKVGWKFGLYFSFRSPDPDDKLDQSELQKLLGQYHNFLTFQNVYESVANIAQFDAMRDDGWFPFLELLAADYEDLLEIYSNRFEFDQRLAAWLSRFTPARIYQFVSYWWRKPVFADKRSILEAGITAFNQGTDAGNINSIKTIYSEVEGILQYFFFPLKGKKLTVKEMREEITKHAQARTTGPYSLFLPVKFSEYLEKEFFRNFDLTTGDIDLSRHTIAHGVALGSAYNRARALQGILVLSQLYYYL